MRRRKKVMLQCNLLFIVIFGFWLGEVVDCSNNIEDSPSKISPFRHEDIMEILTTNEALDMNPDSPDEVYSDSVKEEGSV